MNATNALAGGLSSANSLNYAARKINASLGVPITDCTDVANAMQGGLPSGYSIVSGGALGPDVTVPCRVQGPNATEAIFTATGIT